MQRRNDWGSKVEFIAGALIGIAGIKLLELFLGYPIGPGQSISTLGISAKDKNGVMTTAIVHVEESLEIDGEFVIGSRKACEIIEHALNTQNKETQEHG